MSKTVKIPDYTRPNWVCCIGGHRYVYPAGSTQEVPDEVAELIEDQMELQPKEDENAGSGGGVSSWNDLKDKPFGDVIEVQNYHIDKMTVANLEEYKGWYCKNLFNSGIYVNGQEEIGVGYGNLVHGQYYTVLWDGVEYEAEFRDVEGGGCFGHEYYVNVWEDSQGLPFGIFITFEGRLLAVETTDPGESHTFAIYTKGDTSEAFKTIDPKYMPNSVWLENGEVKTSCDIFIEVIYTEDSNEDGTYKCNLVKGSFYEAKEKLMMGLPVSCFVSCLESGVYDDGYSWQNIEHDFAYNVSYSYNSEDGESIYIYAEGGEFYLYSDGRLEIA